MISKIYKGQKYEFEIGKRINEGGNGIVYDAKCNDTSVGECVIKIFKKNGNFKNKRERFIRFKQEIKTVLKLQENNDGLIKIIDFNRKNNKNKYFAWYAMEKATIFQVNYPITLIEKLNKLIDLAKIIKSLHNVEGSTYYAHRDIKPSNIFIINDKIKLSDFGLVWCNEYDRLTGNGEKVGPAIILPPELERVYLVNESKLDFRKSDIYLFGKVVWMYVMKNNTGFYGEYDRSNSNICLDKNTIINEYGNKSIATIEPLHLLLEGTTKNDPNDRINIETCIFYITEQINIINNSISQNKLQEYKYLEVTKNFVATKKPQTMIYKNPNEIKNVLNEVVSIGNISIKIKRKANVFDIEIDNLTLNGDYIIATIKNINNKIYLIPNKLELNVDTFQYLLIVSEDNKNLLKNIDLFSFSSPVPQEKSKLDETFEIVFEKTNILISEI